MKIKQQTTNINQKEDTIEVENLASISDSLAIKISLHESISTVVGPQSKSLGDTRTTGP